jgi:tripartite-type tricarboxylate transporter receptor subunit TctC
MKNEFGVLMVLAVSLVLLCPQSAQNQTYPTKPIDAFKKIYDDPDFKSAIAKIDVDQRWEGPDSINESIRKSVAIVVPMLKGLGLYVER